jgi:CTD kinase subunit alpha
LLHQSEFLLLPEHIKSLAKQLCEGLLYIHSRSVLHRDLKTANLLVTSQGTLKIGDFGLARYFNRRKKLDYTNRVCTYWYRAPELMLGETVYGPEIDMWGAGYVIFLLRVSLLNGL